MSPARRGFTLLEVLVAISILGIGLTAILSAQTGLFASSLYAERVSAASGLLQCRMGELELKMLKMGYPLVDQTEEGPCCNEEATPGYTCKWKIEKILLPNPPSSTVPMGGASATSSGSAGSPPLPSPTDTSGGAAPPMGAMGGPAGLGAIGALAALGQSGGSALGSSPQLGDVTKLLSGGGLGSSSGSSPLGGMGASMMGGSSFLAPLVMGLVYPQLKPMLEASIRKLTVTVEWKDGSKTRNVEAIQFVTNPQQGGVDPNAANGLNDLAGGGLGGLLGGAGLGTGTGTGTGTGLGTFGGTK
jgi:general secretion pathway protein I